MQVFILSVLIAIILSTEVFPIIFPNKLKEMVVSKFPFIKFPFPFPCQDIPQDNYTNIDLDSVEFYLYPDPLDMDSSDQLIIGDKIRLNSSRFNRNLPLILLIHGFKNNHTTDFSRTLTKAYLTAKFPANIINVNWKGAIPYEGNFILPVDFFYGRAVKNIPPAATLVTKFLNFLIEEKAINGPEQIHIVGFSLGAHLAGVSGHMIYSQNKLKIQRITGLDPAGPLFQLKDTDNKLDETDANFVDIVHTNKGMKGIEDIIGHVDFFPNGGGPNQPGCSNMTHFTDTFTGSCSHAAAYKFYAKSILDPTIQACRCDKNPNSGVSFNNQCDKSECLDPITFGQYCPESARGIYYLNITLPKALN